MAAVTQTINSYLGGVSRQTDKKKLPGQVRECLNAYPDPTFGLRKRPGFKYIKTLHESSDTSSPDFANAKWFFIKRDDDEQYIGCILDSDVESTNPIKIWNKTGTACTVTYDATTKDYLNTTRDNYDILTVQDTTIITNKTTEVLASTTPSYVLNSTGRVIIKLVDYSSVYNIKIKTGGTTYDIADVDGVAGGASLHPFVTRNDDSYTSGAATFEKLNVTEILTELKTRLDALSIPGHSLTTTQLDASIELELKTNIGTGYSVATELATTGGSGSELKVNVGSVDSGKVTAVAIHTAGTGYAVGDVVIIDPAGGANCGVKITAVTDGVPTAIEVDAHIAFELEAIDERGGANMLAYTQQVPVVADLPAQSIHDKVIKVINSSGVADAYWTKFVADNEHDGTGYWQETRDPTVPTGMNPTTLPHELKNTNTDEFRLQQGVWTGRNVGDLVTNSDPSFVGSTIQQTFFHNNRFGVLTEDNVSMSQTSDFFNFYYTSALTATDSDPIDINTSSIRPATLHAVIPTAQGLILFSKHEQFILFADAKILTPSSTIIRGISNYEMDAKILPVDVGTNVTFVSKTPSYTRVFNMITRGSDENPMVEDIGKVVSEWIPDTVTSLISSPQNSLIAMYGTLDDTLYLYKTYIVGDRRLMQAWVKWDLPGNIQHVSIDSDTMWSVVEDSGVYHLISASLTQTPEETIMTTADGQQINPHMDMYTAANNGEVNDITTFTHNAATETARTPNTYTPDAHAKGASFKVVVADAGSGVGGAVTVTKLTSGSGYVVSPVADTITLASDDIGGGNNITVTVTAVNEEKKVVYDVAEDFSKCYIPYADLTNFNPVILIAGNEEADLAGVTEFGFTVNPTRATDSDGTYFKVTGKNLESQAANVYVGYQYNYDVELPKTYFKLNAEGNIVDYTASLIVSRMKFAVGLSSVVGFKLNSKGRNTPSETYTGVGTVISSTLVADGTGAGPEGDHTVKNVATTTKKANGADGDGTGMTVNVTMSAGKATAVTVHTEGKGYAATDTITIAKGDIGDTTHDVTATITTVGQTDFPFNLNYEDVNDLKVKVNGVANTGFSVIEDTDTDSERVGKKLLKFTTPPGEGDTILLYTGNWYTVQPVQDANQYLADDVPLTEETVFTLPIHQKSENFNVRVFSNSPFPVSLSSMMWEGQYSPRYYRRT